MGDKKFDVIVYGATGYTGKLVVEYMVSNYKNADNIRWAIAGRSEAKLKSVADTFNLSESIEAIVVDSNNQVSVDSMVEQSKCVLTTVGPYQLYGSNILKACAKAGTDYVDLCGEPAWMHQMLSLIHI